MRTVFFLLAFFEYDFLLLFERVVRYLVRNGQDVRLLLESAEMVWFRNGN